MRWYDTEDYRVKEQRLLTLIDRRIARGPVALVGSSAGASVVINAYAQRPTLVAAVCIAGKINNPGAVGLAYKKRWPSFWQSVQSTTKSLEQISSQQRARILSIRARYDEVVPAPDSIVEGANNRKVWTMGHALTIGWQLIVGAPRFVRFAKQQNSNDTLY